MGPWGMCTPAPKLLELGAKKCIPQELAEQPPENRRSASSALELRVYS